MTIEEYQSREMLIYAFRYALGRMSAAPSTMIFIIGANLKSISNEDLKLFIREINEADDNNMLGMEDIDKPMWLRLKDELENELLSLKV